MLTDTDHTSAIRARSVFGTEVQNPNRPFQGAIVDKASNSILLGASGASEEIRARITAVSTCQTCKSQEAQDGRSG